MLPSIDYNFDYLSRAKDRERKDIVYKLPTTVSLVEKRQTLFIIFAEFRMWWNIEIDKYSHRL